MNGLILNCLLIVLNFAELEQAPSWYMQGVFILSELVTRVFLNCVLVVFDVAELSQALVDLYAG